MNDDEVGWRREALDYGIRMGGDPITDAERALAFLYGPAVRPKIKGASQQAQAFALYESGAMISRIAVELGVAPSTVSAYLAREKKARGIQSTPSPGRLIAMAKARAALAAKRAAHNGIAAH